MWLQEREYQARNYSDHSETSQERLSRLQIEFETNHFDWLTPKEQKAAKERLRPAWKPPIYDAPQVEITGGDTTGTIP